MKWSVNAYIYMQNYVSQVQSIIGTVAYTVYTACNFKTIGFS